MDEQLEVFNKRVNQQLLGFVDARSFFLPIGQSAKHGHGMTRVDFTTTNNEFHFLVSPKSAKNLRQELLHSLEKADFSPEDVPRMLHQAVALPCIADATRRWSSRKRGQRWSGGFRA